MIESKVRVVSGPAEHINALAVDGWYIHAVAVTQTNRFVVVLHRQVIQLGWGGASMGYADQIGEIRYTDGLTSEGGTDPDA